MVAIISPAFNHGIREGYYSGSNPASLLRMHHLPSRERFLNQKEVVAFFTALRLATEPTQVTKPVIAVPRAPFIDLLRRVRNDTWAHGSKEDVRECCQYHLDSIDNIHSPLKEALVDRVSIYVWNLIQERKFHKDEGPERIEGELRDYHRLEDDSDCRY